MRMRRETALLRSPSAIAGAIGRRDRGRRGQRLRRPSSNAVTCGTTIRTLRRTRPCTTSTDCGAFGSTWAPRPNTIRWCSPAFGSSTKCLGSIRRSATRLTCCCIASCASRLACAACPGRAGAGGLGGGAGLRRASGARRVRGLDHGAQERPVGHLLSGGAVGLPAFRPLRPDNSRGAVECASLRYYALALSLFVAALLSKTVTSTLPIVILLLIWYQYGRVTRVDVCAHCAVLAAGDRIWLPYRVGRASPGRRGRRGLESVARRTCAAGGPRGLVLRGQAHLAASARLYLPPLANQFRGCLAISVSRGGARVGRGCLALQA